MTDEDRSQRFDGAERAPDGGASRGLRYGIVALISLALGAAGTFVILRSRPMPAPAAPAAAPAEDHAGMAGMETAPAGEHPSEAAGSTVHISSDRQQLIGMRTAAIGQRELGTTIRTVGTLAYDETRVAQIHTKISGWVEDVYIDYVGRSVRRDEPLLTVYSPELVSTQNEYLLARKNKETIEASAIQVTRSAAESLLAAARDRLELWDIPEEHIRELEETGEVRKSLMLHSPFDGIVLERNAFPGQYVTPEMTIFKIADLARIWAFGAIFEYELPLIRVGQEAEIEFPYGQSTRSLKGEITFIYPDIDPQTRRVRIRAEFPNPGLLLKPETFVTVVIHTGGGHRLAIPKEAVIDTGTKRYAILAHPNGYFEPREIEVGAPGDEFYPLLGGLEEGELVVTSAQFLIDSETNLQAAMQSMIGMHGMDMEGEEPMEMPEAPTEQLPSPPSEHQHPR